MANGNWSASRISTFKSCPLKYYYTYVKKWISSIPADNTAANKGLAFHETVEQYETGMDKDTIHKLMEQKIEEYHVNTNEYDEFGALERFYLFWEEYIAPKEQEGFVVKKESWASNKEDSSKFSDNPKLLEGPLNEPFVGALDLFLENPDTGEYIIFDYKSGKSPIATKYRPQLILYAYLIGLNKGYTPAQIAEKCKLYVFFPLAQNEDIDKIIDPKDKMFASVKALRLTESDIEKTIRDYKETIDEIHTTDWENPDANKLATSNYLCQWCDFQGSKPNRGGFMGCPASQDFMSNNAIFTLKE